MTALDATHYTTTGATNGSITVADADRDVSPSLRVTTSGLAVVYKTKVDNHSGEVTEKRMHRVRWGALDGHPEHEKLEGKKKDHMENFAENSYLAGDDEDDEETMTVKDIPKPVRDTLIRRFCQIGVKQKKIGAVFELGRSTISKIKNEKSVGFDDEHAWDNDGVSAGADDD